MNKIDDSLPTPVLSALAEACGFRLSHDVAPGVDAWTLSHDHGPSRIQHVGTRQNVCAFLAGYADMQLQTSQLFNELDKDHRSLVLDLRTRLGL